MLYVFSDVIIGFPGDDDNIEIDENDHEQCFQYLTIMFRQCLHHAYDHRKGGRSFEPLTLV